MMGLHVMKIGARRSALALLVSAVALPLGSPASAAPDECTLESWSYADMLTGYRATQDPTWQYYQEEYWITYCRDRHDT